MPVLLQSDCDPRHELRRFERVVNDLPVGVVVLDDQRRCLLVNAWVTARAAAIGEVAPGATLDQIAGISCERLVGGELREEVTVGAPAATLVIDARGSADGRETVVVLRDVTLERLHQARAEHRDRLALIGQLAGGIAHDFNNLLFLILNYAGMLEDALAGTGAEDDAKSISQAAESATELARQLLAFSRSETPNPKRIDVGRLVARMQRLLQRAIGSPIALVLEPGVPGHHVLIDPTQLEQILMNLVVNARDAIAGAGTVSVRVVATEHAVTIEVADTGSGMPPEVVARVFEPYFTTKALGKGTGLGLTTVLGIVRSVGGEIAVTSEPGRGTTFRVALPRSQPSETGAAAGDAGPHLDPRIRA
ncbi:MAG TPA: ATP-binding protein [Kofleriaceae bacterium]|nr:ATP-binding protein [Kofleriaceae bacterium]